jgi:hypothetical protein
MLTTNEKGSIAEQAIVLAAIRAGAFVLRPLAEGGRYDLIIDIGPRLLLVQCKSGALRKEVVVARTSTCRHTPRGYVSTTYSAAEVDALAIYCDELNRSFLLPIDEVAGMSYIHLRLTAARKQPAAAREDGG